MRIGASSFGQGGGLESVEERARVLESVAGCHSVCGRASTRTQATVSLAARTHDTSERSGKQENARSRRIASLASGAPPFGATAQLRSPRLQRQTDCSTKRAYHQVVEAHRFPG